jgi:hypothetical protein
MRPGLGHLLFGIILLAAGIGVTLYSEVVYWYGAIIVGAIEILRGLFLLARSRPN